MTAEDHLKQMCGDLFVLVAQLRAQIDELEAKTPAKKPSARLLPRDRSADAS